MKQREPPEGNWAVAICCFNGIEDHVHARIPSHMGAHRPMQSVPRANHIGNLLWGHLKQTAVLRIIEAVELEGVGPVWISQIGCAVEHAAIHADLEWTSFYPVISIAGAARQSANESLGIGNTAIRIDKNCERRSHRQSLQRVKFVVCAPPLSVCPAVCHARNTKPTIPLEKIFENASVVFLGWFRLLQPCGRERRRIFDPAGRLTALVHHDAATIRHNCISADSGASEGWGVEHLHFPVRIPPDERGRSVWRSSVEIGTVWHPPLANACDIDPRQNNP